MVYQLLLHSLCIISLVLQVLLLIRFVYHPKSIYKAKTKSITPIRSMKVCWNVLAEEILQTFSRTPKRLEKRKHFFAQGERTELKGGLQHSFTLNRCLEREILHLAFYQFCFPRSSDWLQFPNGCHSKAYLDRLCAFKTGLFLLLIFINVWTEMYALRPNQCKLETLCRNKDSRFRFQVDETMM